jgi:hypothetical protein
LPSDAMRLEAYVRARRPATPRSSTWRMPDMAAMFDRLRDAAAACDDD